MHKIIELTNKSDIIQLQNQLEQANLSMYSLPLRHQLWYAQENIFNDGHVFVDQWPKFRHLCALHSSTEFISRDKFDFDVATFYSMAQDDDCEQSRTEFELFLHALAKEREWNTRRSMFAHYVLVPMIDLFEKVLGDNGKIEINGKFLMYTGIERDNIEKYKNRFDELLADLPDELWADELRLTDVEQVIENWSYGPTGIVADYFRWLLKVFPSTCLRNRKENNKLIAWACQYSCGAIGNLFIDSEYRGRGLSEYLWLSIGLKLTDFCPLLPYFNIRPENLVSVKSSEKAFHLDRRGDTKVFTSWFFFYNRQQFPDM